MGVDGYAVLIFVGLTLVFCMVIGIVDDKKKSKEQKQFSKEGLMNESIMGPFIYAFYTCYFDCVLL